MLWTGTHGWDKQANPLSVYTHIKVKYQAIFINELSFVQVSAATIGESAFKWV